MPLHIDQLRAFATVAECGSFTVAGRKLGKAQSTISEAINVVETYCGVALFDHSKKSPPLTEAGLSMLRETKSILAAFEAFSAKAQGFNRGLESRLTFAYDPIALPFKLLKSTLDNFQRQYPYIELEIFTVDTKDVLDLVKRGQAQLGVLMFQGTSIDAIDAYGIGNVKIYQVAAPDHPLARLPVATEADLRCYHKLAPTSRAHSEPLRHSSIANHLWYLSDTSALMQLLKAGLGWAVLPEHLAEDAIKAGELAKINLEEQKQPYSFPVDLIWHRQTPLGPAASWLRKSFSKLPA